MPIDSIRRELVKIGKLLNYWQAELFASAWLALFLGLLWLGGVTDVLLSWGMAGRIVFWLLTVGAFGAGVWHVRKALTTSRTIEAVAARVEQGFPQLDNRLINVVQFAAAGAADPIRTSYVRQGVPNWNEVHPAELREREKHKRAYIALAVTAVLLLAPFTWTSAIWGNALARILNPFSSRAPITIAHILSVTPGNGMVVTGNPLTILLTAKGRAGQPVSVDLWSSDNRPESVRLGQLAGKGEEDFSYLVPKVSASLDYRVRAGDAESAKFHVEAVSPLSFSHIDATVTPPKELGMPVQHLNGQTEQIVAPRGSELTLSLTANRPMERSFMIMPGSPVVKLNAGADGKTYTASMKIHQEGVLLVNGFAEGDQKVVASLQIQFTPDLPPVVRIISPEGKEILGAGASPAIHFEASDDFGLTKVAVEQVDPNVPAANAAAADDAPGKVVQEWPLENQRAFTSTWTAANLRPKEGDSIAFRVVAYDNYAGEKPHRTASPMVVFQTADPKDLSAAAVKLAAETQATLDKLVEIQSENLTRTRGFSGREKEVKTDQWAAALDAQKKVREITGVLTSDPRKPLAALQQKIVALYTAEMPEAITLLGNAPTAEAASQPIMVNQAITKEDWILHVLSGVDSAFASANRDQRISDILALMDALVSNQTSVATATKTAAADNATNAALTDRQDRLSGDADAFVSTAKAESVNMKGTDAKFAEVLGKVAEEMGTRTVPQDMLRAADQLDQKAPAGAVPIQAKILGNLQDLQAMLNAWRADSAAERAAQIAAAFKKAESKLDRLAALQSKVLDSMKAWKAQEDATTGKESDAYKELAKKDAAMKEAVLQIAADLQIFPEAQLGNDVVKDVTTTFAKVDQVPGSEHQYLGSRDLQKEDGMLKDIEKMAARIKDGLPTLLNTPTNQNYTTEDFDKTEFPGKVAAIPLADKFDDLIGDLLKLDDDIEQKTKSSATNQATKDGYMEGPVQEGEYANYSAKGKSGNTKPKDNEQSGRSNIGRQGQSDGETAAASGKINQGNDDIHKRMTQDAAQSGEMGKIDDSLAKTVATGGGKLSGSADEYGMAGNGPRRDAKDGTGGNGLAALMKKKADAIYAAASLQHVRTGSLDEAITHLRSAEDAAADGRPLQEIQDYQRMAREALRKTQVELHSGMVTESIDSAGTAKSTTQETAGAADEAPAAYQKMVSDYYKAIDSAPQK